MVSSSSKLGKECQVGNDMAMLQIYYRSPSIYGWAPTLEYAKAHQNHVIYPVRTKLDALKEESIAKAAVDLVVDRVLCFVTVLLIGSFQTFAIFAIFHSIDET